MGALFDARDSGNRARRNIAPGPPATYGEILESIWQNNLANVFSISEHVVLRDQYEKYLESIEAATGQTFENPLDGAAQPEHATIDAPNPPLERMMEERGLPFISQRTPQSRPKTVREREQELFAELTALKHDRFPDLQLRTPEDFQKELVEIRAAAAGQRAEVTARETTLAQQGFALLVNAGTLMLDPPVLASMAFGAPFSTGIVRGALIDAGIGVAVEVPIQASVQATRARLGERTSLSEAAFNVLSVGAGGFLFSGLIRGGVKGTREVVRTVRDRRLARTRAERDALTFLERQIDLEDATPFDRNRPAARAEHEARLSEAQFAAREGQAPTIEPEPRAAIRETIETAAIRADGETFTGVTHAEALEKSTKARPNAETVEQGFLTSRGRFVDRGQAAKIAGDARQTITRPRGGLDVLDLAPRARQTFGFEEGPLADFEAALKRNGEARRAAALADIAEREAAKRLAAFVRAAKGDEELAAFIDMLRRPPKSPRVTRLTQFLKDRGGVKDTGGDLKALGITPRTRPGLINNKTGMSLDNAALAATEAGFFGGQGLGRQLAPGRERATVNELLDALADDFSGRARRLTIEEEQLLAEFEGISRNIDDILRDLDDAGIDLARLSDREAIAALRELAARAARAARPDAPSPGTRRATAAARVQRAGLEAFEEQGEAFDRALERQVREDFTGRGDERIFLEAEDGEITRRTAAEILDDIEQDDVLLREFRECIGA